MKSSEILEAVELLLCSMYQSNQRGAGHSFMAGPIGSQSWDRRFQVIIHYDGTLITNAALFIRSRGSVYLRTLSVAEVETMSKDFIAENYWTLMDDCYSRNFECSYSERVSKENKIKLTQAFSECKILKPVQQSYAFPITPLLVKDGFDGATFYLSNPNEIAKGYIPEKHMPRDLEPRAFPPSLEFPNRMEVGGWLGVRAPYDRVAHKIKAAVLGALALAPIHRERYIFTMRKTISGFCKFSGNVTICSSNTHTPALGSDIVINTSDHKWLEVLSRKISSNSKDDKRDINALEYFYRAWQLDTSDRFVRLCLTLDAIFSTSTESTVSVVNGVRKQLGDHIEWDRIRLLMSLRGSIIHGGAPEVYSSRKYTKYVTKYDADPVRDLEILVAACMQSKIFEGLFRIQDDPHADIISEAKAKGALPHSLPARNILNLPNF